LLGYYSVWPFFLEIAILMAIVSTPLFRAANSPPIPASNRVETLDGLRGFLALSVFFHHAAVYQQYLHYGIWGNPPSQFHTLLAQRGVAMFFMITGYLFYSQLLRAKGRPDWSRLYIGRIARILPLYWFAAALVLIGVGIHTGWHLQIPLSRLLGQIAKWSAGGAFQEAPVNGDVYTSHISAYVTWTLQYEWFFYLSLLVLAIPARWRWSGLLMPPVLLCLTILHEEIAAQPTKPWICVSLFLVGMSTAAFTFAKPDLVARGTLASLTVVGLLALPFTIFSARYSALPVLVLGAAFLLIGSGADVFGILRTGPAKRLGNISYGIYLLQGPVFAAASAFETVRALDVGSPIGHWTVAMLEAIVLVSLATCTHRFIERPGIDLGRRLANHFTFTNVGTFVSRRKLLGLGS
jgi:peptidoglycan/LPS O-acetylase OafA/YrhL